MEGEFRIINFISEGKYTSLFKVLVNNIVLSLKKIKYIDSENSLEKIFIDFEKIRQINNVNVLKYYDLKYNKDGKSINLLCEFCEKGTLESKIFEYKNKNLLILEHYIWIIFFNIIKALKTMHKNHIYHKSLKPSNIYFTESGLLKIGDMNIFHNENECNLINFPSISLNYMGPEIWNLHKYNDKSDIWSLGCVIYELCSLKSAFRGDNIEELKMKILRGYKPSLPKIYSKELIYLINCLLITDPFQRPNINEILEMDIVNDKFEEISLQNITSLNNFLNPEEKIEYSKKFESKEKKKFIKNNSKQCLPNINFEICINQDSSPKFIKKEIFDTNLPSKLKLMKNSYKLIQTRNIENNIVKFNALDKEMKDFINKHSKINTFNQLPVIKNIKIKSNYKKFKNNLNVSKEIFPEIEENKDNNNNVKKKTFKNRSLTFNQIIRKNDTKFLKPQKIKFYDGNILTLDEIKKKFKFKI